jgi:hypothetical protein
MAKVMGEHKTAPPTAMTEPPEARFSLESPGRSVIFGTRKDQKSIAELAAAGFVVAGLIHLALGWNERGFSVIALLFSAFHGGLLGMLIGQLIWVYPDRVMIAFASIGAFLGVVVVLVATGRFEPFQPNRDTFQVVLALAFWFGFIGFWVGFISFAKRLEQRWRYHERIERMEEISRDALVAVDGTLEELNPDAGEGASETPGEETYPAPEEAPAQELFPQPSPQEPAEDQYLDPEDPS